MHDAYFAGLFDGEAHVALASRDGQKPAPLIQVCMTDLPVLELCQIRFGGSLRQNKPHKGTKPHHKVAYSWRISHSRAKAAALAVLPHSVVKADLLREIVKWEPTDNRRYITALGKTMSMTEWAKESGIRYRTIQVRLEKGWSEADAVTKPLIKGRPR